MAKYSREEHSRKMVTRASNPCNNRRRQNIICRRLFFVCVLFSKTISAFVPSDSTRRCKTTCIPSPVTSVSQSLPQVPIRLLTAQFESRAIPTDDVVSDTTESEFEWKEPPPPSSVEELLRRYGYNDRIIKLDFDNSDGHLIGQRIVRNPGKDDEESFVLSSKERIFAEVQEGGISRICQVVGIKTTSSGKSKKKKATKEGDTSGNASNFLRPPRMEVTFLNRGIDDSGKADTKVLTKTIDVGQITTIWTSSDEEEPASTVAICKKVEQILPINHVDDAFENRYRFHSSRGRNVHGGGALTKKQVEMISLAASIAASSVDSSFEETEDLRRIIDHILKQCIRCGSKYSRLLDSALLEEWLFYDELHGEFRFDYEACKDVTYDERRIFSAITLSQDTKTAGRFKRLPCMWLPPQMLEGDDKSNNLSSSNATTLTLVNGGWVVVDQSVRAATEGRKFAAEALASGGRFANDSNNERILCRLESLACGEKLQEQKRGGGSGNIRLEVDVRTTLEAMDLPLSSEGAREALFRMGRWTKKEDRKENVLYERWSPSVLEAAKWYVNMDRVRRREMKSKILELRIKEQNKKQKQSKKTQKPTSPAVLEGRIDLTSLPCICVDSERTAFRDDAFGIRKRSSTGRKVNKKASQWELLFHITDVSDIYAPDPIVVGSPWASGTAEGQPATDKTSVQQQRKHLEELEHAARSRIQSEYGYPIGPLHMLPTQVLQSMSLDVLKQDWTSDPNTWPSSWHTIDTDSGAVNRAVTLWVYIDDRSGYIMDMGFERSIISKPLALSFGTAQKILDATDQQQEKFPPMMTKAKVLLSVVERNIEIWSSRQQERSTDLRTNIERLETREMISNQVFGGRNNRQKRRDDGQGGDFRYGRGHKLVDSTLNLYENAIRMMLRRSKRTIPINPMFLKKSTGRSATAPLRYYLQGLAQRQALALFCNYGGPPIPDDECKETGITITNSLNARRNTGSATNGPQAVAPKQLKAVRSLKSHLQKHSFSKDRLIPAISTGQNSEVVIQGVGVVALCKKIPGTIKPGVKVMVRILQIDEKSGKVIVALHSSK